MKKRVLAILLTLCLIIGITPVTIQPIQGATTVKVGDYIQFGSYYGVPILWRVINLDEDGDPLLFSEKILCLKAYDAKGNYHPDIEWREKKWDNRRDYGSNYWPDSTIRQWLNSAQTSIDWIQNDPSAKNMWNGENPYSTEAGFLSVGNFTTTEKAAIKPVTHPILLSDNDKSKKDGGTKLHRTNENIDYVIQNYNEAYYKNVTDSMFYLDVKQINEYVYDRGWEIRAKPTAEAVNRSTHKDDYFKTSEYWIYALSSPNAYYSTLIRNVSFDGHVNSSNAAPSSMGVRPACYINLSSVTFASGLGTEASPYIVSAMDGSITTQTTISAAPNDSKMLVDDKQITFDAYTINSNNYFKLRDLAYIFSGSTKQFNVTWDSTKKAINLISNQSYTVVGGEMVLGDGKNKTGTPNSSIIYLDEQEITLTAYTINGNNYFKLRDIGQVFDIGVTWDDVNRTIVVDTTKGYEVP